jgi:hypothetical protein
MKQVMTSLVAALAFAAAAQAAEPQAMPATDAPVQAAPAADAAPATQDETKKPEVNDRSCLRHTGTRIATRTDSQAQRRCTNAIGSAYTREDLERTGDVNIADALRKLDPAIR